MTSKYIVMSNWPSMLGQSCHWDMCLWICVSWLSLWLPAENAYFALKAYANIWQSGLNSSDCTLDHEIGWYGERTRMKDQGGREREIEKEAKSHHSQQCVCATFTEMCPLSKNKQHYVTFKPVPNVLQSEWGKATSHKPSQRGTGLPWSSKLSLRCGIPYKDGVVIEVSTQQEIW